MELLERLSVPGRWYPRDIVEVLVRARIAQPLPRRHIHPRAAAHKTQLCPLDPYQPDKIVSTMTRSRFGKPTYT